MGGTLVMGEQADHESLHPGVQRARDAIDAFGRGDLDAYMNFFAEDVVWHAGGSHPLSGDYRGRERLRAYFENVRDLTGGSLTVQPISILANDRHTAMITRVTAQRDERALDVVLAQAFEVGPDRLWTEYWSLWTSPDQEAVDAFWA